MDLEKLKIGVIGLGYVGLPLAVELARHFPTVGFDVKDGRIDELNAGHDSTLEVEDEDLKNAGDLSFTTEATDLADCNFFIVTVPTPIDKHKRPDLQPLISASETIGEVMQRGSVVVYESTVYPGATEEVCVPQLEKSSGLKFNQEFFVGYSPERINPGDKTHRLPDITKITSGSTPEVAEFVDSVYSTIIKVGTHKASSIRVAEAAKVIENTQRDVNIALANELADGANTYLMTPAHTRRARAARPSSRRGERSRRKRAEGGRPSPCHRTAHQRGGRLPHLV